ncbi:MAG: sulfotransferase [gamma proteobacterium symbiont of Lucinoma myriamae]|nr:sulfotransferase [gamma proteobacterium symbiont of Lucinoma myriamae]MCU7819176.1 sulfotransferase [gamma proteobacterium symbiont of Lucinoma myriamae]
MEQKKLIFLISQPRSGSTLIQKLLGAHSKIYTRSETWMMLNPSYELKRTGIEAEYNKDLAYRGLQDFISNLPDGGREKYIKKIRKMYLSLYGEYIQKNPEKSFLDKTPRYHLVIDELIEIFPEANYLLLIRNPLAVLGSIINTWTKENWKKLSNYKVDLVNGIDNILDAMEKHQSSMYILYYEELLKNETNVMTDCVSYLGFEFEKNMFNYYQDESEKWLYGDPENIYSKKGIDTTNDEKWKKNLPNPQYWRALYDYLMLIGEKKYTKLGYNYGESLAILQSTMPAHTLNELEIKTVSLSSFLDSGKKSLVEKQYIIDARNKELKNKQAIIAQRDKTIKQQEQYLQKKQSIINERNNEIEEARSIIAQRNEALQKKDEYVHEKQAIIDARNKELENKQALITQQDKLLKSKSKQL